MKTIDNFYVNGTKVRFTTKVLNRATGDRELMEVEGVIVGGDYNICTFEKEYDVDYVNKFDGRTWTAIGVREARLTLI